jgi:hypothetical protein
MRSNGLHRPVSGSMRAMPRVLPLRRSAYSASPNCASGEGIAMHQRYSPRYEMIVEPLLELPFGEIRGGVERWVQVFQTGDEQRYVKHLGLCKPYIQAQVGYRQSVKGFDQLRPGGHPSHSANSTLSRARSAKGRRRTVLSAAAPPRRCLRRSVSRTFPVPNEGLRLAALLHSS